MKNIFWISTLIIVLAAFSTLSLAQNTDTSIDGESIINKENIIHIGTQIGSHSENLNKYGNFNNGIMFEVFLKYNLSSEVYSIIAFNYWEAQTKEINTPAVKIPSETITSNSIRLEADFTLFKIYDVTLLLGPSILFEKINKSEFVVYSFGINSKLIIPLWEDKVNLLTTVGYQKGREAFQFTGGGTNYSFFNYLLGFEFNLTGLLN
ncbi:MAG: hypothetical protein KKE09_09630 [Bacteroidetes bacterium]|nr:hypothetical protein [Bacteroidota bacterium]